MAGGVPQGSRLASQGSSVYNSPHKEGWFLCPHLHGALGSCLVRQRSAPPPGGYCLLDAVAPGVFCIARSAIREGKV